LIGSIRSSTGGAPCARNAGPANINTAAAKTGESKCHAVTTKIYPENPRVFSPGVLIYPSRWISSTLHAAKLARYHGK
jgi:hypothetical protein